MANASRHVVGRQTRTLIGAPGGCGLIDVTGTALVLDFNHVAVRQSKSFAAKTRAVIEALVADLAKGSAPPRRAG